MKKFLISMSIFIFSLSVFLLTTSPSQAINCTISLDPNAISTKFSGNIKITSNTCNFKKTVTYTILIHPSEITSGDYYESYPYSFIKTNNTQQINLNINLSSRNISSGIWSLEICTKQDVRECDDLDNILARATLVISDEGTTVDSNTTSSPSNVCVRSENGKCVVLTAIGEIDTDPAKFVQKIFSVVLGLGGGIALILIILAGYNFMMSQGNPEKVKGATEQLTSAIIGLLFIIFSFVILQIIGVDILKIPGFQ